MVTVSGHPLGVVATADGHASFVTVGQDIAVMSTGSEAPVATAYIHVSGALAGAQLSHDGRHLLVADGGGAVVLDVSRAETGSQDAVLGTLSSPATQGAIEVVLSADDQFAFVTIETGASLAVFDLQRALALGFGPSDYVGSVPLGIAPTGIAESPDGRWLYVTSQAANASSAIGTITAVDVARAETSPADAVVASAPAGCSPVRVITSPGGDVLWVTARGSNALLGFSATKLRTDPSHSLEAWVDVGEAPVGLALVKEGRRIVVADSNRFGTKGAVANLAVVDVGKALSGEPALLGTIPSGLFPREMALVAASNKLLVTNYRSSEVEVVDLSNLP